ncbi:hypothetical protein SEA_IDYN_68 [Gordonia phage IDyn]|uniref:Uncharacterized protein n=1 Tax=Gordonia phage IDyn TaxID=2510506 RepID=A0A411CU98_9CAUD|nr:hypothetical protein KNU47_gp68 [Gordonia phage IDyn]QAY17416.1 hypothetical protein SEA_IDYN_68 [Gordonia phage IDyn]
MKKCLRCGVEFTPTKYRVAQRFCSARCATNESAEKWTREREIRKKIGTRREDDLGLPPIVSTPTRRMPECLGDPDCTAPVVTDGLCRRHYAKENADV